MTPARFFPGIRRAGRSVGSRSPVVFKRPMGEVRAGFHAYIAYVVAQ